MLADIVLVLLVLAVPVAAWQAWLALFPGIGLRSDYGIRGGWFGTHVTLRNNGSSPSRFATR